MDVRALYWYYLEVMGKSFRQNTKKIVAASLVFWLSGILFLFCCETSQAQTSETESCPLAKTEHCSKQSDGKQPAEFASIQPQTLGCCRFLPPIFDKTVKIEKIQKIESALSTVKISQPKFIVVKSEFPAAKNFRPVVINRENTYLKNCVFRI